MEELRSEGINENAILTAEIPKATFRLTPRDYKKLKGLKSQNLRDHMTDLELIFFIPGEVSTTEIVKQKNPVGFMENKKAAYQGEKIAGDARKALEIESGKSVVSPANYLPEAKKNKALNPGKRNSPQTVSHIVVFFRSAFFYFKFSHCIRHK